MSTGVLEAGNSQQGMRQLAGLAGHMNVPDNNYSADGVETSVTQSIRRAGRE